MNEYQEIIKFVGGAENIKRVYHCTTRLRFELFDDSLICENEIKHLSVVKGIARNGEQFQLIIGPGIVEDVYTNIVSLIDDSINYNAENEQQDVEHPIFSKYTFQKIINIFSDVFIPILPGIIAAGMLMGFRSLFISLEWIETGSTVYLLTQVLTDTAFAFLPVLVAWSSMKRFGGDPVLGIVIGLMMVNPLLPARAAIARETAEYLTLDAFGLTLELAGFQGTVLPALFLGMLGGYTYRWAKKIVPSYFVTVVVPVITTTVCLIVGLVLIGPIFSFIEQLVLVFYEFVLQVPYGIGGLIAGFVQQFLVVTGLHHALIVIDLKMLSDTGENYFIAIRNAGIFGQAGAALSFAILAKNKELKSIAGGATISAVMGITEPAIYGVNLVYGRPFLYGAVGAGFGAMFGVVMGLWTPGTGATGIPGFLQVVAIPEMAVIYIAQSLIALTIPLILTGIFIKRNNYFISEENNV